MENKKYELSFLEWFVTAIQGICSRFATPLKALFNWLFTLRKVIMALPVIFLALELARKNMEELPEMVGFDIQSTGEFAQMISRDTAVYGPLALTCICLILMFLSRRTVYPWLISIFSLVLPLLIWVLNTGLF